MTLCNLSFVPKNFYRNVIPGDCFFVAALKFTTFVFLEIFKMSDSVLIFPQIRKRLLNIFMFVTD
jgi:hypothetical protein